MYIRVNVDVIVFFSIISIVNVVFGLCVEIDVNIRFYKVVDVVEFLGVYF